MKRLTHIPNLSVASFVAQSPLYPWASTPQGDKSLWQDFRRLEAGTRVPGVSVPRAPRHARLSLGNRPALTGKQLLNLGRPPAAATAGLCQPRSRLSFPSCEEFEPPAPGFGQGRATARSLPPLSPCRGRQSCRCPSLGTGLLCHSALHRGIPQARHPRLP